MDTKKVVKLVTNKVRESVVKEALDWKQAVDEHKEKQKEIARLSEPKVIGFKF